MLCKSGSPSTAVNLAGVGGIRKMFQFGVQAERMENGCRVPANEEFDKDHGWAGLRLCRRERDDQSDERSRLTIPPRPASFNSSNSMRNPSLNYISDMKGKNMNISPAGL